MKAITLRYFLTITILILIPQFVFAEGFEYSGFKQGMSVSEAKAHAKSLGGDLTLEKYSDFPDAILKSYKFRINNDHKNQISLEFCKNEKGLFSVSYSVDEGFLKYVKRIEYLKKSGFKIIGAQTQTFIEQAGNEHAIMYIWLNNSVDEWTIKVILFGDEKFDTSNFQVKYGFEFDRFCKQ